MHRRIVTLSALLVLAPPLWAGVNEFLQQRPRVADALALLDVWIEEQRTYQQIPGLSIGIVYDGELIWSKGYGFEDLETGKPVTPATRFRIGSISKLFTATAVMQLRDQGKLRLDDPVSQHLPWFKLESEFSEVGEITVRQLLTHTSGLPREAAFPYWTDHEFPTRGEMIAALRGQAAVYAPATRYKYSNLGMALLGEVVVALSGGDYANYIREQIFAPLGMESSSVIPSPEDHRHLATAYMRRLPDGTRRVMEYYETRALAPAANIVSSVEDLARFAALHLRSGETSEAGPVLRTSTLREMQRPHWVNPEWTGGRGLGFGISRRNDKTIVFHGGWIGGNRGHLLLAPSEKIAVVVMLNADDGRPHLFSYEAYDLVGAALVESSATQPPDKRIDPNWRRYLGVYSDPWDWEYEVMILDGDLVLYSYSYPPEEDASSGVTRLEPLDEATFRMPDGELVVFELDEAGRVRRIRRRYDYLYPANR